MRMFTFMRTATLSLFIIPFSILAAPPTDITNLTGTASDGLVELTWDTASDDGVILGHKIYYGTTSIDDMGEDDYYDQEVLTDSSDTTFTLEGLSNGVNYYFTVTAIDEEGIESVAYSNEIMLTPSSSAIDTPSVISARQISDTEIEVVMSKPIVVKSITQAFQITKKDDAFSEVPVENVEIEGTYAYVMITNGALQSGVVYEVTATSAVEDLSGNPVSSGITDTAMFTAGNAVTDTIDEEPIVDINDDFLVDDNTSGGLLEIPSGDYENNSHNAATEQDRLPPMDVTSLKMDASQLTKKGVVTLTWQLANDVDRDIADQVLYTKEGMKNWDSGYSLGKNTGKESITVKKNTNYGVRIVTVDRAGNESNGAVLNFTTNLTKSGPTAIYMVGGAFVLVIFFFVFGRKRA